METIDISGLDKKEVLKQLWNGSLPALIFIDAGVTPPLDYSDEEANKAIKNGYIDYFAGRAIKTDLNKNTIESRRYDKRNGTGKMQEMVDIVRKQKEDKNKVIKEAIVYFFPWLKSLM